MKIHEYNEMMAYMLRPRQKFAIGGGVVEGEDLGSREGFDAPRTVLVDDDKLVAEWRKQLTGKDPLKWNVFLVKKFGESGRKTLDSRIIRKFKNENIPWNPGEEFSKARYNSVKKLIDEHNLSDKFLYNKQDIYKELNLSRLTRKEYPEIFKLFDTLESKEDKVKKAFDKIVNENLTIYKPKKLRASSGQKGGLLKQMISDIVSPKTGSLQKVSTPLYIQKVLNGYEPYLDMKSDFDYLDKYQSSNFVNKSFNEALEYSQYSRGGLDIKNLTEFKGSYANPDKQIYSFAARHAYLNNKKGTPSQIKFFKLDKKGNPVGKELNFNELPRDAKTSARMLDSKKYGFTYKDKFFNQNTLKTEGFKSGLFDEVYDLVKKGQKLVPNPNNPSEQITLRKLLQDTGDKLTIGHDDAKGGITKQPFNNLRIESGKLNLSLYGAYSRVKNKQLRKLIVDNLAIQFPSIKLKGDAYEQAFINEQSNILKNLNKEKVSLSPYRKAGEQVIKDLGQDFFKQSKPFQKEALRVVGLRSVKGLQAFMKKQGIECRLANGVNCNMPQAYEKSLNELSEKAAQGDQAAKTTLSKFGNKVATAGRFIKGALGPLAIATEVALEGGIALNKTLNEGVPIKQAFADSLTNKYLLGPKLQIDKEAEIAKEMAKGEEFAMAKRGERMFLPQSATADAQRLKKREEEMKALYPQLDMVNLPNKQIDELLAAQGVYSPFTLGFGMQQKQPGIGDMRYNEDVAYDEIRDIFNKGAEEDIRRQQMQSIAEAGGVANLAKGGRAGFKVGSVRKGVLSLIDKSVKSTPKDTTSALDKLIKKTLDEDLFDKKDRIIDSINAKIAKERKKYSYNQKIFEEPSQLEFYNDIIKSNFKTKTGPFFDYQKRKNKAGGGLLKQAGDRSGPPPESGPNPQGLQGLLNRVKKV